MDSHQLISAARDLAPLLSERARDAEQARRPLDEVIDAVRESGIFAMMVPQAYGGHEADLDTFFEVSLILSRADAAMGWLLGFYIEHNYWACGFPASFQKEMFADRNYLLAPASLNVSGGEATKTDGGYTLNGTWQWGTGIVHADWVFAGALLDGAPYFFAMSPSDIETIDNWHVMGMSGTGSWDLVMDNVFVPEDRMVPMLDLINATGEVSNHAADLYKTPLIPILGIATALPMLGAAQDALASWQTLVKGKIASNIETVGGSGRDNGKGGVVGRAALNIEAAELMLRNVLNEIMVQRNEAAIETRSAWLARMAHTVMMCREAVQDIASVTGASGASLHSPIQRALRNVSTGSNHVIFDREMRYADYGRLLTDQAIQNIMV